MVLSLVASPDKAALRRDLRARRNSLTLTERHAAGCILPRIALRQRLLARHRRIGFYIPAKGEIDILPLLDLAVRMGVDCYLPVVPGRGHKKLWFTRLGDRPAWTLNRYAIPEYRHPLARRVRAPQLDILFMPLLGFDAEGWRIGMGGGYYDASLAHLRHRHSWRQPRLFGVAFAIQQIGHVPNDPWDVPLDGILTERGFLIPGQRVQ